MTAVASAPETTSVAPESAGTGRWVLSAAAIALLAAAGAAGVYVVFVRTTLGQTIDEAAMQGAKVRHERVIDVLDSTLDWTSLGTVALVALVAAAVGLLRRRLDLAVAAGILVLGANLTTQLLKTHLIRPHLATSAPNSLPSGHTTAAVSVAFALVLVLPYAARAAVALGGSAFVTVIAVATVWAAWHRPSDTVAALLITLAWGAAAMAAVRLFRRGRRPARRAASRLATVPLAVGGAVAFFAALLGLAVVAFAEVVVPGLASNAVAFLAGAAAIAGSAAATFLIWVRLVADDQPAAPAAT